MIAPSNTPEHRYTIPENHPYARYYPDLRLMTWHPQGVLDDDRADRTVEFVECREKIEDVDFNRFVDMTGYTRIQISLDHVVRLARRRWRGYRGGDVRTALYAVRLISVHIARMYQELMLGSRINVEIFRDRDVAANWLEVPGAVLLRPATSK